MTEPKHIPLPKRWSDSAVERLVRWLQTPDDALVEFEDDPTEEEARLAAEHDRARGYDRPREERAAEVRAAAKAAPVIAWTPPALRARLNSGEEPTRCRGCGMNAWPEAGGDGTYCRHCRHVEED